MKKFPLRICFIVFFCWTATLHTYAQQAVTGSVNGSVSDTSGKQSLSGATITLFDLNDSNATPKYGQAKTKGAFEIKNITEGRYRLLITFEGYENLSKVFSITKESPVVSLGNIIMARKSSMLQEVIVERTPMVVKKDTTEYNAGSFTVKPNAVAEDLLKKLPGVQVNGDGTISVNGKSVSKLLIDGKQFFGSD